MRLKHRFFTVGLLCVLAGIYSMPAQSPQKGPQTRPAPGGGGQPGRPPNPGGGGGRPPGGNRPGGGRPPGGGGGGPQIQPVRPTPSRPNPGGGRPPTSGGRPPTRPGGGRPPQRPPQWGRPPQRRPAYNFRPNDRDYLRRYYRRNLGYINRGNRPIFATGGFFPLASISYITPLPVGLYGYLPPAPPGYQMGYFDGYVVVYDPMTYFLASVVDLLQ